MRGYRADRAFDGTRVLPGGALVLVDERAHRRRGAGLRSRAGRVRGRPTSPARRSCPG